MNSLFCLHFGMFMIKYKYTNMSGRGIMRVLTVENVKKVEALANESGISYLQLMENAGSYCARVIRKTYANTEKRNVLIVCGKGKNGVGCSGYIIECGTSTESIILCGKGENVTLLGYWEKCAQIYYRFSDTNGGLFHYVCKGMYRSFGRKCLQSFYFANADYYSNDINYWYGACNKFADACSFGKRKSYSLF